MSIPGLRATERDGRVIVEFEDIFMLDLTTAISRIFDHLMGPMEPQKKASVTPLKPSKEEYDDTARRPDFEGKGRDSDPRREGHKGPGGGAEGDRQGAGHVEDEARK